MYVEFHLVYMMSKRVKYWCWFFGLYKHTQCYISNDEKGNRRCSGETVQATKFEIDSAHVVATYSKIHIRYNILVLRKLQAVASIWSRIWIN